MEAFPEKLTIGDKEYTLVKQRREAPMAVYKHGSTFLRVGHKRDVEKELAQRDKLKEYGFPIPRRFREGETKEGWVYYTERSMGNENFTDIFVKDIERQGMIDEKSFQQFMSITKEFAEAQLKTIDDKADVKQFFESTSVKDIGKDFTADERKKIEKLVLEAAERLAVFPLVLTHGDFNSHNLYRNGVIDFEGLFYAPVGYDIATNIFNPEFFPLLGDYELINPYRFSTEQKKQYYDFFDKFYLEKGIPRISDYCKYFEFFRATWLTANKSHIPKVHEFRINLYRKYFLEDK